MYNTNAATTMVRMRPGTSPRIEYDHGNDMIARQMYSLKSKAAVLIEVDTVSKVIIQSA